MEIVLVGAGVVATMAGVALALAARRVVNIWHLIPKSNADFDCAMSVASISAAAPAPEIMRLQLATPAVPGAATWAPSRSSV